MEYYIVNQEKFKVEVDEIDTSCRYKWLVGFGFVGTEEYNGEIYYRGKKTNLWPEGKFHNAKNCFPTKEMAEDKLIEIMHCEIEKNETLIENLKTENLKLYEKIRKIHDRRQKQTNE